MIMLLCLARVLWKHIIHYRGVKFTLGPGLGGGSGHRSGTAVARAVLAVATVAAVLWVTTGQAAACCGRDMQVTVGQVSSGQLGAVSSAFSLPSAARGHVHRTLKASDSAPGHAHSWPCPQAPVTCWTRWSSSVGWIRSIGRIFDTPALVFETVK